MRGIVLYCLVFLAVFCACAVGHRRGGGRRGGHRGGPRINSNFTCECRRNGESDDRGKRPCRIQASCLNMSSVCLEKCQNKTSRYDDDERTKKVCCKENNNSTVLEVTVTFNATSVTNECPPITGTVETFAADCTTVNLDQDCRRKRGHRDGDQRRYRGRFSGRFGWGGRR